MEITAKLSHLRISPRKVRVVANLVKGLDVAQAEQQLMFNSRRASRSLLKLLHSATANAKHNFNLTKENLYVSNIRVDQGPALKRWRARAMGRGAQILKRTSYVLLILTPKTETDSGKRKVKNQKPEVEARLSQAPGVVPKEKTITPDKKTAIDKTDKKWASAKLRQEKKRFHSADKFKGAAQKVFRRKSV